MREIKFRGRAKNVNEWCYGSYIFTNDNTNNPFRTHPFKESHRIVFWVAGDWNMGGWVDEEVIPETIGQYTGLKDKNGKEIYEGDILRGDEYPFNCDSVDNYFAKVVWADKVCGFYILTHKNPNSTVSGIFHGNWSQLDEEDIKSFEVIGNIYDNPELIKEEENDNR